MHAKFTDNLSHDPIHGYIRFVAPRDGDAGESASSGDTSALESNSPARGGQESCERDVIDHPWVQRMRQIRQLQTAWWVFPSAEHSRFQHILGVMHLASRAMAGLYESLVEVDPRTPSLPTVEGMMRMAGLLHDVGHGPFGHFFDAHFLSHYGLTHESLGAEIVRGELSELLGGLRRAPSGSLPDDERLDGDAIAWLIQRPTKGDDGVERPTWLRLLRGLFCGIYTIDNMDFVLRDAYMTGLSPRAFDLERILHYSWFTPQGLTIHDRGMPALVHFLSMKAELFRSVYFHRTVRAIDLELAELFRDSRDAIFPCDPRERLDEYQQLTEFSLLTDARRWRLGRDPRLVALGRRWMAWLERRIPWTMVCQRNVSFGEDAAESSSIFSSPAIVEALVRERLPMDLRSLPFRVDLARHIHRPHTAGVTAGLNFYFDSSSNTVRPLTTHGLYRRLPISHTIVRIYARDHDHEAVFASILYKLVGAPADDDATNM